MSIFSKIKSSKQAAQRQKAAKASTPPTPEPTPYRHVPTHAAVDALSGAPAGWKAEDRSAIQEANRKRMSRSESSLSMHATSNRLIRNSSYNSIDERITPSAGPSIKMSKRNSSSASYPPRPIHLGYMAYDGFDQTHGGRHRSSHHGKSPLSSLPMTPADSQSVASSSSSGVLELPSLRPLEPLDHTFDFQLGTPDHNIGNTLTLNVPRNVQKSPRKSVQWKVEGGWGFGQSTAISAH